MNSGRLIYVMGPSGAGKNSLIASAREKLNKNNDLYFTHRYVTRPVNSDDDDFAISTRAFENYRQNGLFALDWQAHGICYGIGLFMDDLLRTGKTVVVNGSRAYLATARAKYPNLHAVLITAPPGVVRARLHARGREGATAIDARAARSPQFTLPSADLTTIDNGGPLELGTEELMQVLTGDANLRGRALQRSNAP